MYVYIISRYSAGHYNQGNPIIALWQETTLEDLERCYNAALEYCQKETQRGHACNVVANDNWLARRELFPGNVPAMAKDYA